MKYYLLALRNYVNFRGRSNRSEYWYFILFHVIFVISAVVLDNLLGLNFHSLPYGVIYSVYVLAVLLPGLALSVRRLHDINKSGWLVLISLIPLVGSIWLVVLMATKGTEGDNDYGPDPNGNGPVFDFERQAAQEA